MKPDQLATSTTEALSQWSVALKQPAVALGAGPVTIGTAWLAHTFLHADPRLSLLTGALVGIASVRYQALVTTVVAVLYALYGALIVLFGMIYVLLMRKNPAEYFMQQLTKITNLAIGFQTQVPVSLGDVDVRRSDAATPEPSVPLSPLPATLGSSKTEDPPLFKDTMRVLASMTSDIAGVVHPFEALRPSIGRHAKPEAKIEADVTSSDYQAMAA